MRVESRDWSMKNALQTKIISSAAERSEWKKKYREKGKKDECQV